MNRPRKTNKHLPQCMYEKHGAYWLVKQGKWTRLGDNLADALTAYGKGIQAPPAGGMVAFVEKAFAHHLKTRERPLSAQTLASYKVNKNRICKVFADFSPEQVKPVHIAQLQTSMSDTPTQFNHTLSLLRVLFAYAVRWQLIEQSPCFGAESFKTKGRKRYITDAEFARIKAHAGQRLQVIMDLCFLTGQRINDVLAIRHSDIDAERGIRFKPSKTSRSTEIEFFVEWTDELRSTVQAAKALQGDVLTMSLLAGRSRKPPRYRTVVGQWWQACEAAGVADANLHDIRAKAATDAKAQGIDAQELLGHTDAKMTAGYIRAQGIKTVRGPTFGRKVLG